MSAHVLTVEVVEVRSGRGDYCEAWFRDDDSDPFGECVTVEHDRLPALAAGLARAVESGAAVIILRPYPPEAVNPGCPCGCGAFVPCGEVSP
jgi:hypothetical protein